MFKLIGADENRHYAWNLETGEYTIGRQSKNSPCDFLIANMTVSRRHASIEVAEVEQKCFLNDLGSHNGTFVNGNRVEQRTEVFNGDHIQFGSADFKLLTENASGGSIASRPTHTQLAERDFEKSVLLSPDEFSKPLPQRVADLPELMPTLFDMAKMLVLPEPKETMLERSLELVTKIIPSDRLAVLFFSEENNDVYTGALHLSKGKDPGTFTLSKTLVKTILSDKAAILIDDAPTDPKFGAQQSIIMSELKSAMAVPLLDEDRVLGILYADTTNPIKRFNDDYLRLFAMIGHIIASRLTNYQRMQDLREKEIIEAELQRASEIQQKLLPGNIPTASGYMIHAFQEQCRAVGGDLYDITLLPDGRLLFLVADVSGKGTGAALLMSNILASFRILYNEANFDLERVVTMVSQELYKHSAPENFATLFVGVLDTEKHTLDFVNAGHNPPLLVRSDGSLKYLDPSGTMIGAFDFSTWSEDHAAFDPGDVLVVFTDGVTEAKCGEDDYSDERLEKLVCDHVTVPPRELGRIIVEDVESYVENTPRSDDITMLIIKRNT